MCASFRNYQSNFCNDFKNSQLEDILPVKDYLVKLVEIDTLEKRILYVLSSFLQGQRLVFTLIVEDTNTKINTGYNHVQLYK